jgi:hypothetical protein
VDKGGVIRAIIAEQDAAKHPTEALREAADLARA